MHTRALIPHRTRTPEPAARLRRGLAFSLILIACTTAVGAQIPETFTNLEVLPEDIDRRALVGIMRGYAGALGVRCNHCHVGTDPDSLEGYDFATDAKETKQVARAMMRMTREINERLLPGIGRDDVHEVSCRTCHHRQEKPQTLHEALDEAYATGGAEAAEARYLALRDELHGHGIFDFSEHPLAGYAEKLLRGAGGTAGDIPGAHRMLDLNLRFHPASVRTLVSKGMLLARAGDLAEAIPWLEKAHGHNPDDAWVERQLERVRAEAAAAADAAAADAAAEGD